MNGRRARVQLPDGFWTLASVAFRSAMLISMALLLILVLLPAAIGAAGAVGP